MARLGWRGEDIGARDKAASESYRWVVYEQGPISCESIGIGPQPDYDDYSDVHFKQMSVIVNHVGPGYTP